MIDSHLHLDDEKFAETRQQIIDGLTSHNVEFVINTSCDFPSMQKGVELATANALVFATVGMHPHEAKSFDRKFVETMTALACHPKVVAVGEIGLDFFYDKSERQIQKDVFAQQIEIADKLQLPLSLHVRDAYGEAQDILQAQKTHLNNGVLWHCFGGSAEFARQMAKKGHYFSFGGAITFKNAKKEEVLAEIPLQQILVETDSPYMAPVPLRGTVNSPYNVKYVYDKLAQVYGCSFDEVESTVRENCLRYFPKIAKFLQNN